MNKRIGGRGYKASYQTTVIRIKISLKLQFNELVNQFREGGLEISNDNKIETKTSDSKAIIEGYKLKFKSSRDWVKFNQLIGELEKEFAPGAEPLA